MAKAATHHTDDPADILAIFGISGDLAKKMTFRALYRLEAAKKLDCPIVGVAIDEWDDEKLRQHAHDAIAATVSDPDEEVFARLAAAALLRPGRLRRRRHLRAGRQGAGRRQAAGLLPGDPALAVRHRGRRARQGRA